MNQNGVFEFLGLGGFFFGYFARFKWPSPEKRTTLAFQPITNNLKLFGQALIGVVVSCRIKKNHTVHMGHSNVFGFPRACMDSRSYPLVI